MRAFAAVSLALAALGAGCVSQPVPRAKAPPPRAEPVVATPLERRSVTDEAATERFLDAQIGAPEPEPRGSSSEAVPAGTSADAYRQRPRPRATDEAATQLFLDHEIERRRYVPPVRSEPAAAVRTVYVEPRVVRVGCRSVFPWATILGASVGAAVGDASGHRSRGTAIGAGLGLLMDLSRTR
jgi:hypothetical protein